MSTLTPTRPVRTVDRAQSLPPTRPARTPEVPSAPTTTKAPLLLLFSSRTSGQSRRVEGFVAHILQRRHNHGSFRFRVVQQEDRPDLFARLGVKSAPTLVVIDDGQVAGRHDGMLKPAQLEELLSPWLH